MDGMELYWYVMFFVLGTVIGSFLNVVLYRLHTGKSLGGRSHCMTCGKTLHWYELLPVVSYLYQKGVCRGCSAYVPHRYLVVEVLTGLSFAWVWHLFSYDYFLLALYSILVSLLILIVFYDIRHTIIPDELTVLVGTVALTLLGYEYVLYPDVTTLFTRIASGFGAGFFFYGLWYISRGRWIGFGDAKLALPLGVIVGVGGVFSMVVFSFWIGAAISLVMLAVPHVMNFLDKIFHEIYLVFAQSLPTPNEDRGECSHSRSPSDGVAKYRRYFTIKSEVPFAPFLTLGFLAVQFLHADIFDITYLLFFW
jgi:leader peptidase (prepilin peptidase)/N-methyltransferase